jgi:phage terminase Nu1 subunit (DNA packaging protein)
MRNRQWKTMRPSNLSEAVELCIEHAAEKKRRPVKVLADLMGVDLKTLYRWLADTSMPLNRIRQFEDFCGVAFVSEYLCMARGDKVVIDIPAGKKAGVTDLAEIQASCSEAVTHLARFYQSGAALEDTVGALTISLTHLAYQRSNVQKSAAPELDFGVDQ